MTEIRHTYFMLETDHPHVYHALDAVLFSVDTLNDWKHDIADNARLKSLIICGNTFNNVHVSSFQAWYETYGGYPLIFYTNSKIGILRKVFYVNSKVQEWNLIKWNIIK